MSLIIAGPSQGTTSAAIRQSSASRDFSRGHASPYFLRGDRFRYNAPRADDGTVADRHSRQHYDVRT
jgi:hypothetical protein